MKISVALYKGDYNFISKLVKIGLLQNIHTVSYLLKKMGNLI